MGSNMWLIDRDTDGQRGGRIPLPSPVRAALVRWYSGTGTRADEEIGITLVQQARIGLKWIACDCLEAQALPPILTPAFLSAADTYYLRRLTSTKRSEHRENCPFFRDQTTARITEVRSPLTPTDPPDGFFSVLRPAPEKLAQQPEAELTDDRTRNASIPKLARLLCRLIYASGLNIVPPLVEAPDSPSISSEFAALTSAAGRIEICPGIELARAFWTHAMPLHQNRVYAALRQIARGWPKGFEPQSFLALFSPSFRGSTVDVAGCEPVVLANRVQSPSVRGNLIKGPYLLLAVVGQYPDTHRYAPLRGYAQPIYSGKRFIPVDSEFERVVLKSLLQVQAILDREGIDLLIEKPVFDRITAFGPCKPDFLLEAQSRRTGEVRGIIVEAMGFTSPDYLAAKSVTHPRMRQIAPVVEAWPDEMPTGGFLRRLLEELTG